MSQWDNVQASKTISDTSGLTPHELLVVEVMDLKAQLKAEKRNNEKLARQNQIRDREVKVLKREERALGLAKLRKERDKVTESVNNYRTREDEEEKKLSQTMRIIEESSKEIKQLEAKLEQEQKVVENLKRKKFEADRELSALNAKLKVELEEQDKRREKAEKIVEQVGTELLLDAKVRQKLSSLRSVAEDTLDLLKVLLDKEYDYFDQTEESLVKQIQKLK
mmetsp:Transcript_3412/g.5045  ORF Transcript_3412/g.5045 Transcript_3412/m.5045 type:complete len:222 (+) Transcript_3412:36-701(+)|eukprot:CAMPEP_0201545074 /NCGR_PEP_ID=MMETSP0173_2-20130828/1634_1 /ASSEMBLY_ACC=CAM_ASM_000268 /TAXON_ID=218659 /ORGANISM="Vexillifera sp., Strain DIVA3 564/2" /LENGTH=221 /DNA_ID=CAMNT_0047953383 /DNA_START=36 /DNA_END=701 /DNA_ORIENTATION=+